MCSPAGLLPEQRPALPPVTSMGTDQLGLVLHREVELIRIQLAETPSATADQPILSHPDAPHNILSMVRN